MKAKTKLGITLAVWAAAFASAASLVLVVRAPPLLARGRASPPRRDAHVDAAASESAAAPVIMLSPLVIVGSPPRLRRARLQPSAEDLATFRCSDWRPLTMGSGSVQLCEWVR